MGAGWETRETLALSGTGYQVVEGGEVVLRHVGCQDTARAVVRLAASRLLGGGSSCAAGPARAAGEDATGRSESRERAAVASWVCARGSQAREGVPAAGVEGVGIVEAARATTGPARTEARAAELTVRGKQGVERVTGSGPTGSHASGSAATGSGGSRVGEVAAGPGAAEDSLGAEAGATAATGSGGSQVGEVATPAEDPLGAEAGATAATATAGPGGLETVERAASARGLSLRRTPTWRPRSGR
ncbi:hypothetical protein SCANM63S_06353 [Streptomyces canarius]